jgi:hypothetical protein
VIPWVRSIGLGWSRIDTGTGAESGLGVRRCGVTGGYCDSPHGQLA